MQNSAVHPLPCFLVFLSLLGHGVEFIDFASVPGRLEVSVDLQGEGRTMVHCVGGRKTNVLFRALLDCLERRYPKARFDKVYVVVDNYGIHKAKAVEQWLAAHPRFELLFLPTYCPQANPIERAFGDIHDKCTRNHQRQRLEELVRDVEQQLTTNGPWHYTSRGEELRFCKKLKA